MLTVMAIPNQRPAGRPREIPDYSLMVQAAQLFYSYGMTRGEIAERLHVQTRKVTELLEQAVTHGIVKITVQRDLSKEQELERALKQKPEYPQLDRALIVERKIIDDEDPDDLSKRLGIAAAEYLGELYNGSAGKSLHLAVSGNKALLECATALPNIRRENLYVHVAALLPHARVPEGYTPIDPAVVATIVWSRSGRVQGRLDLATVSAYDCKAPGPKALEWVKDELRKVQENSVVREVVEGMDDIDVVIGGLGIPDDPGTMEGCLANIITPKGLRDKGVRGDFCHCTFSATGERIEDLKLFLTPGHYSTKLWGVNFFKNMVRNAKHAGKKVVAVALPHHLPALDIALKAGIVNVIVTDTETAKQLVGKAARQIAEAS
jgi:DNA-binding transcriptional regulator LsrR (DeoR family)